MDIIDDKNFKILLQNREQISIINLDIRKLKDGFIEIGGWKFNVSNTIHPEALVDQVMEGWNLLCRVLNMRVCSLIFFIRSADDYLRERETKLTYDIGYEPDMLELLRFCYWYSKCSSFSTINFADKVKEIQNQIGKKLTDKVKSYFSISKFSLDPNKFNRELLKELSHIESTPESEDVRDENGFYSLRQDFLEKISSYVSELMICLLLLEADVRPTSFTKGTGNRKIYDMCVQAIPSDVKTVIDKFPYFDEPEKNLHIEIITSLKREKFWKKINEAIEQQAKGYFYKCNCYLSRKGCQHGCWTKKEGAN